MSKKKEVETVQKPKISVIIPVYNVEKFLSECLDSVLKQTFKDVEIICVNDGSKDSSGIILNKYATRYPQIKVITQKNQGSSVARNAALDIAQGEYIYFMDSDDWIHPQCLEILYHATQKYKAQMVTFNIERDVPEESTKRKRFKRYKVDEVPHVVTNDPIKFFNINSPKCIFSSVCLKLTHRSLFKSIRFPKGIHNAEDMLVTSLILKSSPRTVIIPEKLYFYRQNSSSVTHREVSKKTLMSYYQAFLIIQEAYKARRYKKAWEHIKKQCFPRSLRRMVAQIDDSSNRRKRNVLPVWRSMLADLVSSDCIQWLRPGKCRYVGSYNKQLLVDLVRTSRKDYVRGG